MLLRRTLMPFTKSEALENDKQQLKCEESMYSTRPKMISDVFDVAINFNLKMNNQALNSHLFYHRGNG